MGVIPVPFWLIYFAACIGAVAVMLGIVVAIDGWVRRRRWERERRRRRGYIGQVPAGGDRRR